MMGWQWHQVDHMQIICTSLQTNNDASTSSLKFLQARCSSWHPTNSVKALKACQSTKGAGKWKTKAKLANPGSQLNRRGSCFSQESYPTHHPTKTVKAMKGIKFNVQDNLQQNIYHFLPDFDDGVTRNIIVVIADRTVSSLALVTHINHTAHYT